MAHYAIELAFMLHVPIMLYEGHNSKTRAHIRNRAVRSKKARKVEVSGYLYDYLLAIAVGASLCNVGHACINNETGGGRCITHEPLCMVPHCMDGLVGSE